MRAAYLVLKNGVVNLCETADLILSFTEVLCTDDWKVTLAERDRIFVSKVGIWKFLNCYKKYRTIVWSWLVL